MSDHWMTTYTGGKVVPAFPQATQFHLLDIATALSRICRFNGHCTEFYSVAQHSVLVAAQMPTIHLAREALLHDAPEAYLGDVVSPVKTICTDYSALHEKFWLEIAKKFSLPDSLSPEVVEADYRMALTEQRDLIRDIRSRWSLEEHYEPYDLPTIIPLPPNEAKQLFVGACHQYLGVKCFLTY